MKERTVPAVCRSCGGVIEPALYRLGNRYVVRCAACGAWELVK